MTNMYLFMASVVVINILVLILLYRSFSGYKHKDYMTQLYNKFYLEKKLKKWILKRKSFIVCFFDIDKFKMLNDTYGHLAGDKGIIHFSEALKKSFNNNAIVARIGGDEFAVAATNNNDANLELIFSRLRTQYYDYNGKSIQFTVSIGVCQSDKELSYEKLMDLSDKKMYDNKKNQYPHYTYSKTSGIPSLHRENQIVL